MKVLTFKGKKTERVSCDFQMEDIMKEISLIIYIMAMENSSNLINFMKGTEYLIKWKGKILKFINPHRYGRLIWKLTGYEYIGQF